MMSLGKDLPVYNHFNIISLDGGGVRGALSSVILSRLEETFPALLRDTDLLVGTSTGGVQALEIASGKELNKLPELYSEGAKFVFNDSFFDDIKDFWKLLGADYSNKNLRNILELEFGDMTFAELSKRVAIVAFDLDNSLKDEKKRSWKPKIFHNIDRNHDADLDASVVEVGLATSAAPVYFPSAGKFIDGGVVANNPAMVGLAQALDKRGPNSEKNNVKLERIKILSLGTGKVPNFVEGKDLDWGAARWAPYIFDIMFGGSVDLVDFQCKQLLGDKYCRVNPVLPDNIGLDEWEKVPELVEFANNVDLYSVVKWLEEHWL